jgi:hypothetical protein
MNILMDVLFVYVPAGTLTGVLLMEVDSGGANIPTNNSGANVPTNKGGANVPTNNSGANVPGDNDRAKRHAKNRRLRKFADSFKGNIFRDKNEYPLTTNSGYPAPKSIPFIMIPENAPNLTREQIRASNEYYHLANLKWDLKTYKTDIEKLHKKDLLENSK